MVAQAKRDIPQPLIDALACIMDQMSDEELARFLVSKGLSAKDLD